MIGQLNLQIPPSSHFLINRHGYEFSQSPTKYVFNRLDTNRELLEAYDIYRMPCFNHKYNIIHYYLNGVGKLSNDDYYFTLEQLRANGLCHLFENLIVI